MPSRTVYLSDQSYGKINSIRERLGEVDSRLRAEYTFSKLVRVFVEAALGIKEGLRELNKICNEVELDLNEGIMRDMKKRGR